MLLPAKEPAPALSRNWRSVPSLTFPSRSISVRLLSVANAVLLLKPERLHQRRQVFATEFTRTSVFKEFRPTVAAARDEKRTVARDLWRNDPAPEDQRVRPVAIDDVLRHPLRRPHVRDANVGWSARS
jgi:hypothetical protein